MAKHTNTKEILNPGLLIKYNSDHKPTKATRKKLAEAVAEARSIMRSAVWKMDRVVIFRRPETHVTAIVNEHFRMGKATETKNDRARHLNKIRAGMLSLSFNICTGTYLIDVDAKNHPADSDGDDFIGTRGYVSTGMINGPIHIDFALAARKYSARGLARIIIHEASHKFQDTDDVAYNYNRAKYESMTVKEALNNADSWAYAALSIQSKAIESSATMVKGGHHGSDHS